VRRTGGLTLREDGGIAAATVALALAFLDRQTATEKAIDAVGYGLGAAVIYQLARWAVRFLLAAPRELHAEALAERDRALARVAELEAHRPMTADDWMNTANDFQSADEGDIYALWSQKGDDESWGIYGHMESARQIEALCTRAGAMLLSSPRVAAKLSERVRSRTLHLDRWLQLLREQKNVVPAQTGSGSEHGTPTKTETYERLTALSAAVCVSCSAEEI
jgi:hypothetical protein